MQLHIHPTAELAAPMLPGIPCLASTTWLSQGLSQGSKNLPRLPALSAPSLFPPATPELRLLGDNLHNDSNQACQVPGIHLLQEWVTPHSHGSSLPTHILPIFPTMSSLTLHTLTKIPNQGPLRAHPEYKTCLSRTKTKNGCLYIYNPITQEVYVVMS